jgi:hypothetical protein
MKNSKLRIIGNESKKKKRTLHFSDTQFGTRDGTWDVLMNWFRIRDRCKRLQSCKLWFSSL